MIIQKDYTADNVIKTTYIDGVDKVDVGLFDNGISFCNVYMKNRKKDDDFFTVTTENTILYLLNDDGKTLRILKTKKDR